MVNDWQHKLDEENKRMSRLRNRLDSIRSSDSSIGDGSASLSSHRKQPPPSSVTSVTSSNGDESSLSRDAAEAATAITPTRGPVSKRLTKIASKHLASISTTDNGFEESDSEEEVDINDEPQTELNWMTSTDRQQHISQILESSAHFEDDDANDADATEETLSPLTVVASPALGGKDASRLASHQVPPLPVYHTDEEEEEKDTFVDLARRREPDFRPSTTSNSLAAPSGPGSVYMDPVQRKMQQHEQESRTGSGISRRAEARRSRISQSVAGSSRSPLPPTGRQTAFQQQFPQPSSQSVVSGITMDDFVSEGAGRAAVSASVSSAESSKSDPRIQRKISESENDGKPASSTAIQKEDDLQHKLEQEEQERAIAAGVSHGQLDSETPEERVERKIQEDTPRDAGASVGEEGSERRVGAIPVPPRETQPSRHPREEGERRDSGRRSNAMARQASSKRVLAVAAMVVEDYESEQLSEKQRELQEKEEALAAKMVQLEAWEADLERKRRELEGGSSIVQAEIVSATESLADSSKVATSSGGGGWGLFGGRAAISSHSEGNYADEDEFVSMPLEFAKVHQQSNGMVDLQLAEMEIGPGPMGFAPRGEMSLEEQLAAFSNKDRRAYRNMNQRLEDYKAKHAASGGSKKKNKKHTTDFPVEWQLRFLRYHTTRDGWFHEDHAYNAIIKLQRRFMNLRVHPLVQQLQTKTLFPVPGLRTKDGHDMFYMRPARYFPSQTTARTIIDNLVYVMNTMMEKEHAQTEGVGFIASMDTWAMKNFDVNYCLQFMMALQGAMVPIKTQLFLIVNPPVWFGVVWRIMKPMLAPGFRKKVKICAEKNIAKYLEEGYELYLPDDMKSGKANTDALVEDFIAYRQYVEKREHLGSVASVSDDDGGSSQYSDSLSLVHNNFMDGQGRHLKRTGSNRSIEFSDTSSQFMMGSSIAGTNTSGEASINCDIDGEEDDDASIGCDIEQGDEGDHNEYDEKPAALPHQEIRQENHHKILNEVRNADTNVPSLTTASVARVDASFEEVIQANVEIQIPPQALERMESSGNSSTHSSYVAVNRLPMDLPKQAPIAPSSSRSYGSSGSVASATSSKNSKKVSRPVSHYLQQKLGPGPLRFEAQGERDLEEELYDLTLPDKRAYKNLKQRWNDYCAKQQSYGGRNKTGTVAPANIPMEWYFRFLHDTAKKDGHFHEDRAFRSMMKLLSKDRFLTLRVFPLTKQLQSRTLFPVPGLKTKVGGHAMFYMRPSRYFPKKTSTRTIINNLVYVMNTLCERQHAQKEGIGFVACMDEWRMVNFDINYCYQFMMALQGTMVPVNVQLFLIVNPPAWFGAIWRIMKPMLAPSFRKKVKICKESKISKYLESGFEQFLPDDMQSGRAGTDALVADFIEYRQHVEHGDRFESGNAADDDDDIISASQCSDITSTQHSPSDWKKHKYEFNDNMSSARGSAAGIGLDQELLEEDGDASIDADIDQEAHHELSSIGW